MNQKETPAFRQYGRYVVHTNGRVTDKGQRSVVEFDSRSFALFLNKDKGHRERIDRVMARLFMEPRPAGHTLAHRDGNKRNNKLSNLYWSDVPLPRVAAWKLKMGKQRRYGIYVSVYQHGEFVGNFESLNQAAKAVGLSVGSASKVLNGKHLSMKGLTFVRQEETTNG